ncbi:hypothetical protein [Paenibacillus tuaregi]|uniref:hypothetical protein n=1 Tax=Paenibacillus tuaregi TaxID=1816681 RepID=UPI000837AE62|nr:hypothetical protein [Paenibacillus tuaregi]
MFVFEKKQAEKALAITVSGFMKPDEAEAFLKEYNEHINSINPAEYTLIIDSTNLAVSKQDMLPVLEGCFKLYMSNGFKKIMMVNPSSVVAKNQMHKLAETIAYTGIFVDSLEEAYSHN